MKKPKEIKDPYFGLTSEEKTNFMIESFKSTFSKNSKLSRAIVLQRRRESEGYIVKSLYECVGMWSYMGRTFRINDAKNWVEKASRDPSTKYYEGWEEYIDKYLKDPNYVRNPLFYVLYHACIDAQTEFSFSSAAPQGENTLTGKFLAYLEVSLRSWSNVADTYLLRCGASLELATIDLQIGGLEEKTGGDFSIILEIDDAFVSDADTEASNESFIQSPRGTIIVPIIFQAKRYKNLKADISQHHEVRKYQYDALKNNECSSAYIFFNNDVDRIDYPAPPMVKPVLCCEHPSEKKKTEVFENSVDFSTYILRVISGCPGYEYANSREEAIRMILPSIESGRLNTVAVLSSKPDAGYDFGKLIDEMRSEGISLDIDTAEGP